MKQFYTSVKVCDLAVSNVFDSVVMMFACNIFVHQMQLIALLNLFRVYSDTEIILFHIFGCGFLSH